MIHLKQKEERGFENQGKMRETTMMFLSKMYHRLNMTQVLSLKNQLQIPKAALLHCVNVGKD